MNVTRAVATLVFLLSLIGQAAASPMVAQCQSRLAQVPLKQLEAIKQSGRIIRYQTSAELRDGEQCAWVHDELTGAVLIELPIYWPLFEVDVSGDIDSTEITAANVALLDENRQLIKWASFEQFRERQGKMRLRFVVPRDGQTKYLWIGGAGQVAGQSARRTFEPGADRLLRFAGLVTGREKTTDAVLQADGRVTVRITEHKSARKVWKAR